MVLKVTDAYKTLELLFWLWMRVHCFFTTPVSVEGLDRGLLWLPPSQNLLARQQQTSRKMHPYSLTCPLPLYLSTLSVGSDHSN